MHKQTERQPDKLWQPFWYTETDRDTDRDTEKNADRDTYKHSRTERQTYSETNNQTDKQADIILDKGHEDEADAALSQIQIFIGAHSSKKNYQLSDVNSNILRNKIS